MCTYIICMYIIPVFLSIYHPPKEIDRERDSSSLVVLSASGSEEMFFVLTLYSPHVPNSDPSPRDVYPWIQGPN